MKVLYTKFPLPLCILLLLPFRLASTSCAISHYRNEIEIIAGEPMLLQVSDAGARAWKWSVQAKNGSTYPVTSAWIGESQLVQLTSPRFKPGRNYALLINGKDACEYLCGEQDKHLTIKIIKNPFVALRNDGAAEEWNLSSVQIDAEGASILMNGKKGAGSDGSYYIARLEETGSEDVLKKQYQNFYPMRNTAGESTVYLTDRICTSLSFFIKHGRSYKLTLFRPSKWRLVKSGGWCFTVPERGGFNEVELQKIKELEKYYSEYIQNVNDKSKNDAFMNWKKANKELNDRYNASRQITTSYKSNELKVSSLMTDQISDLEIKSSD